MLVPFYYNVDRMKELLWQTLQQNYSKYSQEIETDYEKCAFLTYAMSAIFSAIREQSEPIRNGDQEAWARARQLIETSAGKIAYRFLHIRDTLNSENEEKNNDDDENPIPPSVCSICQYHHEKQPVVRFQCCQGVFHTTCFVNYKAYGYTTCPCCRGVSSSQI